MQDTSNLSSGKGIAANRKKPRKGIFYGWWVIAALFFVGGLGPMGRYSLSVLSPFLEQEFQWSKSQIGMAFSIHLWVYSFLAILVGWMLDRVGSRRVIFLGGSILLIALILLSRMSTLWQLYLYFGFLTAAGVSMTHFVPTQATSRRWFIKRAGLTGGIVTAAFSVGAAAISPALTSMSDSIGWRDTWFVTALFFGITIMLLAVLVLRNTPESVGLHPDGAAEEIPETQKKLPFDQAKKWSVKEALRTRNFWLLFTAYALVGIPMQGLLTQIVMWGVDLGQPLATAGIFMTALSLPAVLSKVLGGHLGDRYGKRKVLIVGNGAGALVMLVAWLVVNNTGSLLVMAGLMGMVCFVPAALFPAYLGDLYGRAPLGTLIGIQASGSTLIGGLGPLIWSVIAERSGSYNLAALVSAIAYAACVVVLIPVKRAGPTLKQ